MYGFLPRLITPPEILVPPAARLHRLAGPPVEPAPESAALGLSLPRVDSPELFQAISQPAADLVANGRLAKVFVDRREPGAPHLAFVNGNFILSAGLNAADAIAIEKVEGNPYANMLVWRTADDGNASIKKLDELLHSDDVAEFIKTEWPSGDVIPG